MGRGCRVGLTEDVGLRGAVGLGEDIRLRGCVKLNWKRR